MLQVIGSGSVAPEVTGQLTDLAQRVDSLEKIVAGGTNFKGQVDNIAALPQDGNQPGDIYQTTDDNKNYIWDGDEWKEYGSSLTLTNDLINTDEFEIVEGKLNLKAVNGADVTLSDGKTVQAAVDEVKNSVTQNTSAIEQNTTNITNITNAITWQEMV